MKTIDPNSDMSSLGKLAEILQASPNRIERAAERAGIRPGLRLNGVVYYTDLAIDPIRRQLKSKKRAKA